MQAGIDHWFAQMQMLPTRSTADRSLSQTGLRAVCVEEGLASLAAIIVCEAPVPGRSGRTRGDWLDLLRVFVAVRAAVIRSGGEQEAPAHGDQLAAALFAEGVGYAAVLNRLLFSEDAPELPRLATDFLRLDTLQWALEELGAERELYAFREILLLLAGQVMSRINAVVRQLTHDADPLARFNVAALLLDIEELIALAGRLLEPPVELAAARVGRGLVIEFIAGAHQLVDLLGDELATQLQSAGTGSAAGGDGEDHWREALRSPDGAARVFAGKLKQLGLLYQFATRLEGEDCVKSLEALSTNVYALLRRLTAALLALPGASPAPVASGAAAVQLATIAALAEELGWHDLQRQALTLVQARVLADVADG